MTCDLQESVGLDVPIQPIFEVGYGFNVPMSTADVDVVQHLSWLGIGSEAPALAPASLTKAVDAILGSSSLAIDEETMSMLRVAVHRRTTNEGADLESWAEGLARDVKDAND